MIQEICIEGLRKEFLTQFRFICSEPASEGILRRVCEVEETILVLFLCVEIEQRCAHADHCLLVHKEKERLARTYQHPIPTIKQNKC